MEFIKKIKGWLTLIIFFSLTLIFSETLLNNEVFSEKYGLDPLILGLIFLVGELAFVGGIVIMLKGSGLFRMKWKDIVRHDFSKVHFNSKVFMAGFVVNRLAAFVPWAYVLGMGWKVLPATIVGLIILELGVVVILTLGVIEVTSKHATKEG